MTTGFTLAKVSGEKLGSARFDGSSWTFDGPKAADVKQMVMPKLAQGWSPEQVLWHYDGWSNGPVKTTAIA